MPEFRKSPRFKSNPRRDNGDRRGFRDRGPDAPREMFDAECNACHKTTRVPFRPNGRKPVYCSDCFKRDERSADRYARPERTQYERREAAPQPIKDPRIDDILRQLGVMNATIEKLEKSLDAFTRTAALSKEVRKHIPAEKPAPAPKKTAKAVKKVTKATKKTKRSR